MNREQKRKVTKKAKGQAKQKFTLLELQKAMAIALEMNRESKGHLFSETLKNKATGIELCVFCGQDRTTTIQCESWFITYHDRLQTILINPLFFVGADQEAYWLQHGTEYEEIRIPMLKVVDE
jgi:hypothetical protein